MSSLREKGIMKPTLLFGVTLILLFWILIFQNISLPNEITQFAPGFRLSQMFLPILSILCTMYTSILISKLMEGRLVGPVSNSIKTIGVGLALFQIAQWDRTPPMISLFLFLPLQLALVSSVSSILTCYFESFHELVDPIVKGLALLLVSLFLSQTWAEAVTVFRYDQSYSTTLLRSVFSEESLKNLGSTLIYSILFTALSSMVGIIARSMNPYVSFLGKWFGHSLDKKFYLYFFVVSYFIYLREPFLELLGANKAILPVLEWGLVSVTFFQAYKAMNRHASDLVADYLYSEKLVKHVQEINYISDKKMNHLSKMIDKFIEGGDKSLLVVTLSSILSVHGYGPDKINRLLWPLIDYEDILKGSIAFYWQNDYLDRLNRDRREKTIRSTLESFENYGLYSAIDEEESQELEEKI